ncbi:MAG TPA: hypothetical protein VIM41_11215, partial [Gammaproteobacteria bacterium]
VDGFAGSESGRTQCARRVWAQGWPTTTYRDVLVASPGRRRRRRPRVSSYRQTIFADVRGYGERPALFNDKVRPGRNIELPARLHETIARREYWLIENLFKAKRLIN